MIIMNQKRRIIPVLLIMLSLTFLAVEAISAKGKGRQVYPPLFKPNQSHLAVWGLAPKDTRVWKERVFPNGQGNVTALCIENLVTQRIFPAAGPARGDGVFCLGDLQQVGVNEYKATAYRSGCLGRGSSRKLFETPNCRILVSEGIQEPGTSSLLTSRRHVITCPSVNGGLTPFGTLLTSTLAEGEMVGSTSGADGEYWFDELTPGDYGGGAGGTPPCGCRPDICDPCCATCPD